MYSQNQDINVLVETLIKQGLEHFVISPGSRNAPIIGVISQYKEARMYSIVDERSAAFFALGMAQFHQKPTVLLCTSGSAVLNYSPAIAEAFYQRVPLLVVSADRPPEWIDQADGQCIRQFGVFDRFIKYQAQLLSSEQHRDALWHNRRCTSEAIQLSLYPQPGPVHLNLPLREPLYAFSSEKTTIPQAIQKLKIGYQAPSLPSELSQAKRIMLLVGQLHPNSKLSNVLEQWAQLPQGIVLYESTSNIHLDEGIDQIDNALNLIPADDVHLYQPEVLITVGSNIVSKRIKQFLRSNSALVHIHIGEEELAADTYKQLRYHAVIPPLPCLDAWIRQIEAAPASSFGGLWFQLKKKADKGREQFLKNCPWSDLKLYQLILNDLPKHAHLQIGNSSVIRYIQLFEHRDFRPHFANRGVSGIDGCTSTAIGYASQHSEPTVLISGDMSFMYDSNGLWNQYTPPNFVAFVINNGGGNIFRIIDGPSQMPEMENFIETAQDIDFKHLAQLHEYRYFRVENERDFLEIVPAVWDGRQKTLVECRTPRVESPAILNEYWKFCRKIIES